MTKANLCCDPKEWIDDTFRRIMIGFSFRDPEQIERTTGKPVPAEARKAMREDAERHLDANIYVQALKRMGIQVLYHHAKSHTGVCCYATRVGHRFSLMGDRDFFGELVTACRNAGIVPGAMYQVGYDMLHSAEHPEWRQMDASGKRSAFRLCPNNPEWRRMVMTQTEEIAQYDIGAFMYYELSFHWHNIGIACYCPHCRARFREDVGDDMPEKEDWQDPLWRRFVQWRYDCILAFIEEGDRVLKRVNPNIAHTSIYYGYPTNNWQQGWDAERTAPVYDFLLCDVGGVDEVAFRGRWYRALSRRRPEIACGISFPVASYTHYQYSDNAIPKPSDMFLADVMTALANGATPAFESMGWTNHRFWNKEKRTMCSPAFDRVYRRAAGEIKRREPWLTGTTPVRHALLLHSRRSRDFRHGSDVEAYTECFRGWHEALLNGQVLFDMGTDGTLSGDTLAPYKLLILPDISCLSDAQAAVIREYVRAGGGLVASFSSSLFDEEGRQRPDFALGDVLGVSYAAGADTAYTLRKNNPANRDQYFMSLDTPHPFFKDILVPGEKMTCPAPVVQVHAKGSVQGIGRFTIHHQDDTFEGRGDAVSGRGVPEQTDHPVIVTNRFGRGRAVYLSSKFAASYKIHGHPLLHRLMCRAVCWAGGRAPVEVVSPPCIEVNAFRQDAHSRLVVHLVNYQSVPRRGRLTGRIPLVEHILPVHDLEVRIQLPAGRQATKVYLAPREKALKWERSGRGRGVRVTVPEIGIHTMVVVEHRKAGSAPLRHAQGRRPRPLGQEMKAGVALP